MLKWVREFGQQVRELSTEKQHIEMVEVDEMHSYIGSKKNYCWIWIAVDRYGKRFIDFVIGKRGNETAEEFWEKIKGHEMDYIASDDWKPYESTLPKEKLIQ